CFVFGCPVPRGTPAMMLRSVALPGACSKLVMFAVFASCWQFTSAGYGQNLIRAEERPALQAVEPLHTNNKWTPWAGSAAVVVQNVPQLHTTQLFATNDAGELVAAGNAAQQLRRVLQNVRQITGERQLARLNLYAA